MDDVISAHKPRLLDVAAQHTRSLGLGYKRRVGIHVAGNRRTGLLLAVGLGGSTGGRSLRSICAFSSPYPPESTQPKRHLDQFSRFCRAHVCVQQTDRHTDRDAMTDRHTDRPRYIDSNRPHLMLPIAMWPHNYHRRHHHHHILLKFSF